MCQVIIVSHVNIIVTSQFVVVLFFFVQFSSYVCYFYSI